MLNERGDEPGIYYKVMDITGLSMSEVGEIDRERKYEVKKE